MAEPNKLIVGGELVLYGYVGGDDFFDDGFSGKQVLEALAELDGDITVHINSGGGSVWDGSAIHNALKAYDGKVTVIVDGVAASSASLIAMAGKEIVMAEGAIMMIHNASFLTIGTKVDHEVSAGMLGKLDSQMTGIYARRTGAKPEDIKAMMDAETWFTADEAVKAGFADKTTQAKAAEAAAFDYSLYPHAPKHLLELAQNRAWIGATAAAHSAKPVGKKEHYPMPDTNQAPASGAETVNPAVNEAALKTVREEAVASATAAERTRVKDIRLAVMAAKLPDAVASKLIDDGVPIDKARADIIDALAKADGYGDKSQVNAHDVRGGDDGADKFRLGAEKALLARANLKGGERNEFSGYTLAELARASLERRNVKTAGMGKLELAGAAFVPVMAGGMHSTSDFATILASVASKSMLRGWEEAEETFQLWTSKGSLPDFKATNRIDLNLFPALAKVEEGAEYTYAKLTERGETIQLATYGKLFAITRQAIINDDANAFTKIPARMGRAARRTVANLAYAVLTANATMADGNALFSAAHANIVSSGGAAPSVTTLSAARTAMRKQADPDSIATGGLNIRAKYILLPAELETSTLVLLGSEFDPAQTQRVPNGVRSMVEPIVDARLSAASTTAWYLAGDPNVYDTVEVAYLDGNEQPFLDQQDGWSVDGTEFKVRIDAGVKALDFRALYKNVGA